MFIWPQPYWFRNSRSTSKTAKISRFENNPLYVHLRQGRYLAEATLWNAATLLFRPDCTLPRVAGLTRVYVHVHARITKLTNRYSQKIYGRRSSRYPMSFENRFKILPTNTIKWTLTIIIRSSTYRVSVKKQNWYSYHGSKHSIVKHTRRVDTESIAYNCS